MSVTLPTAFSERLLQQLGPDEFAAYAHALKQPAPVSIRLNTRKVKGRPALEPVPWTTAGYYLPSRPSFTLDPLLHAGTYYVQEASSMFLEQALKQAADLSKPLRVLDLCGAPGGKSTHLASLLPTGCLLVSNEVIRSRANILAENLQKWGAANVIVTNNDPRDFGPLQNFFDVIVVDAPCSGEGLFRKDPNAMDEWSEANVKLCSERQRRILMDVWETLRPGGLLIYSTCTYSPEENEVNLIWLTGNAELEPVKLQLQPQWGVVEKQAGALTGYQFYPHRAKGEGLFMAAMRKAGNGSASEIKMPRRSKIAIASKQEKEQIKNWVDDSVDFDLVTLQPNIISLFPFGWLPELELLSAKLRIITAGTEAAEVVKKDVKPLHALALSQHLNKDAFPSAEVDIAAALRYLHREDIPLPEHVNGWVLIKYKNQPLGWAKKIGNRTNNYYPKEWRIRMSLDEALKDENLAKTEVVPLNF